MAGFANPNENSTFKFLPKNLLNKGKFNKNQQIIIDANIKNKYDVNLISLQILQICTITVPSSIESYRAKVNERKSLNDIYSCNMNILKECQALIRIFY